MAACIKANAPDLSWVYLEYTDDMGHRFGDSPPYFEAIQKMDRQVGRIWESIQYREKHFNENWLIFVTTDDGRDEQTGKAHGGQSARQRSTWMVTNYRDINDYARYYWPGITDITTSILQFMDIRLPLNQLRELDGTSLIGPVSIALPQVNYVQGNLDVSWKALDPSGKVSIWVAATNNYKKGKPDDYKMMGTVPVNLQHALISVKNFPSGFYKVWFEAPYNTVNRWCMVSNKP